MIVTKSAISFHIKSVPAHFLPVDTVVLEHFDIVVWARFGIVDEVLVAERCCRLDEESVGTVVWEPGIE